VELILQIKLNKTITLSRITKNNFLKILCNNCGMGGHIFSFKQSSCLIIQLVAHYAKRRDESGAWYWFGGHCSILGNLLSGIFLVGITRTKKRARGGELRWGGSKQLLLCIY
jgi:hypothetical protein